MFHQDSDEVQVTFHGASVYFSEEEWRLLQEWQKELYSTVMKEIHQALISLGPLIATTVCSLRSKEKEESYPLESQEPEQKHSIALSSSATMTEELYKVNKEEEIKMENPKESGRQEVNECDRARHPLLDSDPCFKKEPEPVPIFIDHLGAEIDDDSNSGHEVVSFLIEDEEETSDIDTQDTGKGRRARKYSGDGRVNIQRKTRMPKKNTKQGMYCKAAALKNNTKGLQSPHGGPDCKSQWAESCQKWSRETTAECENASVNSQHSVSSQERSNERVLQGDNASESGKKKTQVAIGLENPLQNQTLHPCKKCDKIYCFKQDLVKHMRRHSKGAPFVCTECGKQFLQKGGLIHHYRIHTGEKPFSCIFCHKSFIRKDYLEAHIRTHTGERPYKCTDCEKTFIKKGELNQHRRKHT